MYYFWVILLILILFLWWNLIFSLLYLSFLLFYCCKVKNEFLNIYWWWMLRWRVFEGIVDDFLCLSFWKNYVCLLLNLRIWGFWISREKELFKRDGLLWIIVLRILWWVVVNDIKKLMFLEVMGVIEGEWILWENLVWYLEIIIRVFMRGSNIVVSCLVLFFVFIIDKYCLSWFYSFLKLKDWKILVIVFFLVVIVLVGGLGLILLRWR